VHLFRIALKSQDIYPSKNGIQASESDAVLDNDARGNDLTIAG
jgi:hypothetical protein